MTLSREIVPVALVAVAIFAYAWHSRILAPPKVLSAIGIAINLLTILVLASVWLRC